MKFLRENWGYIIVFALMAFLVATIFEGCQRVSTAHEAFKQKEQKRTNWFQKHDCKPTGYVGGGGGYSSNRIYTCNDGVQYIWRDIPTTE